MPTMAEWYLKECGGSVDLYQHGLKENQRAGQAFFNALSDADKELIRGTEHDPYNSNNHGSVVQAIACLMDDETRE